MDKAVEDDIKARTPKGWYGLASPSGWDSLVADLHTKLKEINPDYEVYQIKSKFGTLRYYCSGDGGDQFNELISEAERKSAEICEVCGQPGVQRCIRGWYETTCDVHSREGASEAGSDGDEEE